ncbi:MAG: hypothetical protein H0X38_05735 [Planctomycetes bacterium]|nr:hypothetical protein [Planctomycetota bacterium]
MINGTPTPILIDTGFNGNLLVPISGLDALHLVQEDAPGGQATGLGGDFPWWRTGPVLMILGGSRVDLSSSMAMRRDLALMGTQILRDVGAVIDCGRQVFFAEQAMADSPWSAIYAQDRLRGRGYCSIPFLPVPGDGLLVRGMIAGHAVVLGIDTGANSSTLDADRLAAWGLVDDSLGTALLDNRISIDASGRLARMGASRPLTVELGAVRVEGSFTALELATLNRGRAAHAGEHGEGSNPLAGIIGMDVLLAHRAIIDFRTATMYLTIARAR